MSDLVGNPENRFSHNEAHIKVGFEVDLNRTDLDVQLCLFSDSYLQYILNSKRKAIISNEIVNVKTNSEEF